MSAPFSAKQSHDVYENFQEFWPFYLSQHRHGISRLLHVAGTTLGILITITAIIRREPALILLALVFGYGFAWIGHFGFEKNVPATFRYFKWSLLGDFKMLAYFYTGRLSAEFERFGIPTR